MRQDLEGAIVSNEQFLGLSRPSAEKSLLD